MSDFNQEYQRAGLFVPTTNIWDVARLEETDVNSDEFKELLVRLYQNVNNIAVSLNLKEGGYYVNQPFVTGALFFPNPNDPTLGSPQYRQVSRIVVNFGPLPAAGTKSVPHNLTIGPQWTFTRISGASTNPTLAAVVPPPPPPAQKTYIPLPYVSVLDPTGELELSVDSLNVNITTGGTDYSAWTITYVVIEYLTT